MGTSARLAIVVLVIVAVGLAVPAVRHLREQPPPAPPPTRLTFSGPAEAELGSGEHSLDATISPDEREVVFVATAHGTPALWRRRLDEAAATRLVGTDGALLPTWTPDGRVLFFAEGRLKSLTLVDGRLSELVDATAPAGVSAMSDGSLLVAIDPAGPIERLANGWRERATTLQPGDRRHAFPSPTGSNGDFVYVAVREDGRRVARLVVDGRERELTATSGHAEVRHGRLIHVRDGTLVADPIERTDPPTPRATLGLAVGVSGVGRGAFAVSPRLVLYAPRVSREHQLEWLDLATGGRTAVRDPGEFWRIRLAPDDAHVAVTWTEPQIRTLDVVTMPTTPSGTIERVSLALAADTDPVWAPDGRRLLFRSLQAGRSRLHMRRAHAPEAPPEPLPQSESDIAPTDWRGGRILASIRADTTGFDLWNLDEAGRDGRVVVNTGFNETDGRWSPDGRWVAYVSDESGRPDIYAARLRDNARVRVSFGGGTAPRWSTEGRTVFFLRGGDLMRASLVDQPEPAASAPEPVTEGQEIRDVDVAHRPGRALLLRPVRTSAPHDAAALLEWAGLLPQVPANARRLRD